MDLDTRPPEMERSTMMVWIQQCPNCGHCAKDVSHFAPELRGTLESPNYRQHLANKALPPLAAEFICAGLLQEAAGSLVEAGWEYLHAAWIADDAGLLSGSKQWRDETARCWRRAMDSTDLHPKLCADLDTIMVDCLRRAGRGQEALPIIDRLLSGESNSVIEKVLVFQRELITHEDFGRHTVSESIKQED